MQAVYERSISVVGQSTLQCRLRGKNRVPKDGTPSRPCLHPKKLTKTDSNSGTVLEAEPSAVGSPCDSRNEVQRKGALMGGALMGGHLKAWQRFARALSADGLTE